MKSYECKKSLRYLEILQKRHLGPITKDYNLLISSPKIGLI